MTSDQARARAEENFLKGYNCTQSVVEVFAEELGYDRDMALKLCQPFGAGICRMREVCGTVSGMLACAGMKAGKSDGSKEGKDEIYKIGQELADRFRKDHGSIICRELLGLVPLGQSDKAFKEKKAVDRVVDAPISQERTSEYYKKRPCPKLCGDAAAIFNDWLEAHK